MMGHYTLACFVRKFLALTHPEHFVCVCVCVCACACACGVYVRACVRACEYYFGRYVQELCTICPSVI